MPLRQGVITLFWPQSAQSKRKDMSQGQPHTMEPEEVLRVKLESLRREHRDLDEAIGALEDKGTSEALTIRRLKKQKLSLKDRIAAIEDRLTPDIIA